MNTALLNTPSLEKSAAISAWSRPRSEAGEPLGHVEIWDVSVTFRRGSTVNHALENTSVDIAPGSFVCLLGPSGCGKSTLLNTVAGYVKPTTGWARVDGEQVLGPGSDRGMVFQQYSLFPWKTIRDNVAFGPYAKGSGRGKARAIADELLEMVGLARFADRYPAELSGGMQQRVGIARALANKPAVLLMDEPFGALDSQTRARMQENLLRIWADFKITVIFVTHDVDEAIFLADRVLVMGASPGRIIEDVTVPLGRPRVPDMMTDPDFNSLKRHLLQIIRAESLKSFEDQDH
ncbi:MAG TPA: ABC transporter ATP-binding protein [Pseudolabrys sp.]|nr:ABC transporter ATP-binding protein [Pseudolabrys sp.]